MDTLLSRNLLLISTLIITLITIGCDDDDTSAPATGSMNVQLTDAPFPTDSVEAARVTIDSVQVRAAETDGDTENGEEGPFFTISTTTETYNLLTLTNGATDQLASAELPTGFYDQVRLYVSDASITLTSGTEFDLKIPSGAQSGIKINVSPDIEVESELSAELLLDFDVSKSFVLRGNAVRNGFIFKPVIRAANVSTAGRISGSVLDGQQNSVAEAQVWVTKADTVFSSTIASEQGEYELIGLPEDTYNLRASKAEYDTTTISNVSVTAANDTEQDISINQQ